MILENDNDVVKLIQIYDSLESDDDDFSYSETSSSEENDNDVVDIPYQMTTVRKESTAMTILVIAVTGLVHRAIAIKSIWTLE